MSAMAKALLAVVAALSLSGCNMVMTDKPMFASVDGIGAPPLHPGVWRSEKPGCTFDESRPEAQWPLCSDAQPSVGDPPFWQEARGEPVILQMPVVLPGGKASDAAYVYLAIRPLRVDVSGRIVAMKSWPVRCGPPPPVATPETPALLPTRRPDSMTEAEWSDLQSKLAKLHADTVRLQVQLARTAPTKDPLPGLKMNGAACTPDTVASLRAAARASEAWTGDGAVSHWVRDQGPEDKPPATPQSLLNAAGTRLGTSSSGSAGS